MPECMQLKCRSARGRAEAYTQVLSDLEIPQETLMQELEIHGHLRYNLCCILSAFQVGGAC